MSKHERITFRLNDKEKEEILLYSKKENISVSDYVYQAVMEKMKNNKLNDSQSALINVLDIGLTKSLDNYSKRLIVILNRIDFNLKWLLKQQDIFMQQLRIPQTKEELSISFIPHPIMEKAEELVIKDIRKMSSNKKELEDEQE